MSTIVDAQSRPNLVLVVNNANQVDALSRKQIIDIYMGRFSTFPNGIKADPLDFPGGSIERQTFYEILVGKNEKKIKAYWSRLLFSGRAIPPEVLSPKSEIISTVAIGLNTIAYMDAKDVTPEMKIVYQL
jgi:hypothetical protein